jgi:large subunit ribosomal protein L23
MDLNAVILKPVITEKTLELAAHKRYTFLVAKSASKYQIAQAASLVFGVDVLAVTTTKLAGKQRRFGRMRQIKRLPDRKKAVVTVKPDQKIDLFEIKEQK